MLMLEFGFTIATIPYLATDRVGCPTVVAYCGGCTVCPFEGVCNCCCGLREHNTSTSVLTGLLYNCHSSNPPLAEHGLLFSIQLRRVRLVARESTHALDNCG